MDFNDLLAREKEYGEDKEWLKKQQRDIRNKISKCLMMNGFKKVKRSLFIRMEEDLIVYFVLEHPPGHMYINFCIYPLFIPQILDCITLSIGNRLEISMNDSDMVINDYYTMEEVDACCEKLTVFIQERANPFIQQIDTTRKLLDYFLSYTCSFRNIVTMIQERYYEILMYGYLSLHKYEEAKAYACRYSAYIDHSRNTTEEVKNMEKRRCADVLELADTKKDSYVDSKVNVWKAQNLSIYVGNQSRI